MIEYDDSTHTYSDNGRRIPSVTQVLSSYYKIGPSHYAYGSAERGRQVHAVCAGYANGCRFTVSAEIGGYVNAFRQWLFDRGAKVVSVEQMVSGTMAGLRFAGRYDLTVVIDGKLTLVDLKTGAPVEYFRPQLAAYAYAMAPPRPARAMILYLKKDGTYKPDYLTPAQLFEGCRTFAAALAAWEE